MYSFLCPTQCKINCSGTLQCVSSTVLTPAGCLDRHPRSTALRLVGMRMWAQRSLEDPELCLRVRFLTLVSLLFLTPEQLSGPSISFLPSLPSFLLFPLCFSEAWMGTLAVICIFYLLVDTRMELWDLRELTCRIVWCSRCCLVLSIVPIHGAEIDTGPWAPHPLCLSAFQINHQSINQSNVSEFFQEK